MRLANASIEKGEDTIRFATMQASRVLLKKGSNSWKRKDN